MLWYAQKGNTLATALRSKVVEGKRKILLTVRSLIRRYKSTPSVRSLNNAMVLLALTLISANYREALDSAAVPKRAVDASYSAVIIAHHKVRYKPAL